eukprot:9302855-Pyramimonas_sp.AAC.1
MELSKTGLAGKESTAVLRAANPPSECSRDSWSLKTLVGVLSASLADASSDAWLRRLDQLLPRCQLWPLLHWLSFLLRSAWGRL